MNPSISAHQLLCSSLIPVLLPPIPSLLSLYLFLEIQPLSWPFSKPLFSLLLSQFLFLRISFPVYGTLLKSHLLSLLKPKEYLKEENLSIFQAFK